jgi:hypothetical protein
MFSYDLFIHSLSLAGSLGLFFQDFQQFKGYIYMQ